MRKYEVVICVKKRKYWSMKQAEKAIQKINKPELKLRIYSCPICQRFHLTKLPPGGPLSRAAAISP